MAERRDVKVKNPWIWVLLLLVPFIIGMLISFVRGDQALERPTERPPIERPPVSASGGRG
ncbi:MAG: hypothetical protein ACPGRX_05430 [Bdellovibrionales bacterium]